MSAYSAVLTCAIGRAVPVCTCNALSGKEEMESETETETDRERGRGKIDISKKQIQYVAINMPLRNGT
jgi:hypothetical protein